MSTRTPACHELALRILLQSLNSHASRYSKYVVPLLSLSIDFYFRLFVLVFDSQLKAKESVKHIGMMNICVDCHTSYPHHFGHSTPIKGNVKFVPTLNERTMAACTVCDGHLRMVGPLWLGPIHEPTFVKHVIEHVKAQNDKMYKHLDIL